MSVKNCISYLFGWCEAEACNLPCTGKCGWYKDKREHGTIVFYNPLADVIKAAHELYPGIDCEIQFDPAMGQNNVPPLAETFKGHNTPYIITISANLPVIGCIELLAHELAHVADRMKHGHGKEWETKFKAIIARYNDNCRKQNEKKER